MAKGFDVSNIESLDDLKRLKEQIRSRELEIKGNKWVKMVDDKIVMALRAISRVIEEDQFDANKHLIEKRLDKISLANYKEESEKLPPLRRKPRTKT